MIYEYLEFFRKAGIETVVSPLLDERYHISEGNFCRATTFSHALKHSPYIIYRYIKQIQRSLQSHKYDVVVLEKELLPYFPYGLECLLKGHKTKMVTLYDDAMHTYYANHPNLMIRFMSNRKIERIMKLSDHIVVWNACLGEYARDINPNVTVVNTGVDLRRYRIKNYEDSEDNGCIVIGWIGTPSSYDYIRDLEGVFRELAVRYRVTLRIVSSLDYISKNINIDNRRWSISTEVDDLCSFDIGIMPLPNSAWANGKSGCKAVQYLAVGVPAVCSPVGVVKEIIQDGVNGFLADTHQAWFDKLSCLIEDQSLRRKQGLIGRKMIEDRYSIQAIAPKLISVLRKVGE